MDDATRPAREIEETRDVLEPKVEELADAAKRSVTSAAKKVAATAGIAVTAILLVKALQARRSR